MTESELRDKLNTYANVLVNVISQACSIDIDRDEIFHQFLSAYEDAFALLLIDDLIIQQKNGYDKINWYKVAKFGKD